MGGAGSLISSVFNVVGSLLGGDQSDQAAELRKERLAREEEQRKKEADERRRDREKVVETRRLEDKRDAENSLLSGGAASLEEGAEASGAGLKRKLGE